MILTLDDFTIVLERAKSGLPPKDVSGIINTAARLIGATLRKLAPTVESPIVETPSSKSAPKSGRAKRNMSAANTSFKLSRSHVWLAVGVSRQPLWTYIILSHSPKDAAQLLNWYHREVCTRLWPRLRSAS